MPDVISGDASSGGSNPWLSSPGAASATGAVIGFAAGFATPRAGKGRLAARGQAAYSAKLARLAQAQAALQYRTSSALHAFEQQNPGMPAVVDTFNPDPRVRQLTETIQSIQQVIQTTHDVKQQKKLIKREEQKQAKLERRTLKEANKQQIRVANAAGPNAGYWREYGAPAPLYFSQRGG
jgi:hypothetical protein